MGSMAEERACREAPRLVALIGAVEDETARGEAWAELLDLADEVIGAKRACDILHVLSPNLYSELRSAEAVELFGASTRPDRIAVPVVRESPSGGREYRLSDIERLAKARRARSGGRRKRKSKRLT